MYEMKGETTAFFRICVFIYEIKGKLRHFLEFTRRVHGYKKKEIRENSRQVYTLRRYDDDHKSDNIQPGDYSLDIENFQKEKDKVIYEMKGKLRPF